MSMALVACPGDDGGAASGTSGGIMPGDTGTGDTSMGGPGGSEVSDSTGGADGTSSDGGPDPCLFCSAPNQQCIDDVCVTTCQGQQPDPCEPAQVCDVVMLTYNPGQREERAVLDACLQLRCGALVKKALGSGHLLPAGAGDPGRPGAENPLQASMDLVFGHPGTSAAIVGTIDQRHLQADVEAARRATG